MLLMVEKGIKSAIYHTVYRYVKAINKYMKNYDKNKNSSYLKYLNINNSYRLAISLNLILGSFKWVKEIFQFNEDFVKIYNDDRDEGYFLEVDFQYPENLHNLYHDLPFLPERMKIEKVEKFVANLHDKIEYLTHIKNLKQALTLSLRTTPFGGFTDYFPLKPFFGHFLLFLEQNSKSIVFCTKFYVKAAIFLWSNCTSFLLRSKPVQRNWRYFLKSFRKQCAL